MNIFLSEFVRILGTVLYIAMLGRVILSWINVGPRNPISVIIYQITEPILQPIRRVMPKKLGMLDFSPMIAIVLITVVQRILSRVLVGG